MATIEQVLMNDDLDERIKNGVETVTFFDPTTGEKREIELGEKNREHLANHLAKLDKYIAVSRVVETPKPATKPTAQSNGRNAVIRKWAQENGFQIGDRGRIKADIVEAYDKAHNIPTAEVKADIVEAPESKPETISEPVAEDTNTEQEPTAEELAELDSTPISEDEFLKLMESASDDEGNVTLEGMREKLDESDSNE